MARAKLSLEATQPDPNLRFMIGHLNVLEPLMLELSDAEVEHQKYFHRYASGPTKPVEFHKLQLDTVTEELPGEDSFTNADQFNAPVISRPQKHNSIYDLARDGAQLKLIQTPSRSSSQPLLTITTRMGFSRDNLEQQHTISSHRDVFSTILDLGPNIGFRASRLVTDDAGIVPRPQEARTAAKIRASALFSMTWGRPQTRGSGARASSGLLRSC
ncbi:hypothetical protein ACHAQA_009851 [Verticillium albo-atrum]